MAPKTCKRGHPRTPENTALRNGIRTCLDCRREKATPTAPRRAAKRRTRRKTATPPPFTDEALLAAVERVIIHGVPVRESSRAHEVPIPDLKRQAWARAKELVRARDADTCWRCGAQGQHDVHHRRGRQSGGTSDPRIEFGLANLILLDRECHQWVETHPRTAVKTGLRLTTEHPPHSAPLKLHPNDSWWLLTTRGTRVRIDHDRHDTAHLIPGEAQ